MVKGRWFWALLLSIGVVLPLAGCANALVDSIAVSPASQTIAMGQTAQFTATGTIGHGNNHPSSQQDVTAQATWSSSAPSVATVSSSGLATAVAAGTTTITATMNGYTGVVSSSATLTVTATGGGGTVSGTVTSISVIPNAQTVASPGGTSQFIPIGTTSAGVTEDLAGDVAWSSSSIQIATVNASSGLATAVGQGTATITALYVNPGGSTITGSATFTVSAGTTEKFTALTILPSTQTVSASGQTGNFIALATLGSSGLQEDVTNSPELTWSSSIPTIATITSGLASGNGIAAGVSAGNSTITAELTNPDGSVVTATASVTVTLTPAPEPLLSLTIIPSTITVGNLQDTGNFLAIGTYSTPPTVRDLTNSVTWLSSAPNVFPVSTNSTPPNPGAPGGIVTAYGNGSATIIAEATDPTTGSIQTATASFNCPLALPNPNGDPPTPGTCYPGSQASGLLVTLTIYNEGLNTTNWLVTAPSATGTQDVIHCGPGWALNGGAGGSVCTATYPLGTTVTLTAPAGAGSFGGWSYNCTPTVGITAAGPNSCTIMLGTSATSNNGVTSGTGNSNVTVGAIFN